MTRNATFGYFPTKLLVWFEPLSRHSHTDTSSLQHTHLLCFVLEEKQEQALSSLVVFASNDDDPYITKKDDESDEVTCMRTMLIFMRFSTFRNL